MYIDGDTPASTKITAKVTDDTGDDYKNIAEIASPAADTWVNINGTVKLEYEGTLTAFDVYIESADTSYDFYVDDVEIRMPVLEGSNFETSLPDSIAARGGETLALSNEQAYSGSQSLKVSTRTKIWEGPQVDMKDQAVNDGQYYVTARVIWQILILKQRNSLSR